MFWSKNNYSRDLNFKYHFNQWVTPSEAKRILQLSILVLSSRHFFFPLIISSKRVIFQQKKFPWVHWTYGNIQPFKGIFSDSNNIFLWHESEDINQKTCHFQNFSWFQFNVFKFCMIICVHCSQTRGDRGVSAPRGESAHHVFLSHVNVGKVSKWCHRVAYVIANLPRTCHKRIK